MDHEFIFPPGVPEEFQEKIKSVIDHQKMTATAVKQAVARLFRELSADHLDTLALMFGLMANTPNAATFYEGFARAILAERHDRWPGWGEDEKAPITVSITSDGITAEVNSNPLHDPAPAPANESDKLIEYGLTREPNGRLSCTNCGVVYISLEDRMRRAPGPEGCSGCIQKSKWG